MHTRLKLFAALVFTSSLIGANIIARADTAPPVSPPPGPVPAVAPDRGELKAMDAFLDTHSVIDDELREHPALADNPDFIKDHPEYAAFLTAHPGVAGQLKDHPRYFMHRALELQRDQPITPAEVKTLDAFLDRHPDIDKALVANPKIIDDPKFIEAHPELHDFLKDHPRVAGVLISKPHKTIRRVVHHEHHERPKVP